MCAQFAAQACPATNARQLECMATSESIPERVEQATKAIKQYWDTENMRWLSTCAHRNQITQSAPTRAAHIRRLALP